MTRRKGQLGDTRTRAAVKDHEKRRWLLEERDVKAIMSTEIGRRFYYRTVYVVCQLEAQTYDYGIKCGIASGRESAWIDGKRWVGAELKKLAFQFAPDEWDLMVDEATARDRAARSLHEKVNEAGEETTQ